MYPTLWCIRYKGYVIAPKIRYFDDETKRNLFVDMRKKAMKYVVRIAVTIQLLKDV